MNKLPHKKDNITKPPHHEEEHEVLIEEFEDAEATAHDTIKKIRNELAAVRHERDEHLAGWQRAKADLVNFRRMVEEGKVRDALRAKASLARSLLPALDSFESAMASEKWQSVSEEWRKGIERIHAQLSKALTDEGFTSFGEPGEIFDPTRHECMSVVPVTDGRREDTVAHVLQRGYALGDEVVRPAKVTVAQSH